MKTSTRFTIKHLAKTLPFWLFCCLLAPLAWGQSTNASIVGVVRDETGEGLPGAVVRVRNESTGFEAGTLTNVKGEYVLQQLPLGTPYSIAISMIGYQSQRLTGFSLNQGDRLIQNVDLKPSSTNLGEVVVTASFVNKETERAGEAIAITSDQIKNLPSEGRNFTALTRLSPLSSGNSLGSQRSSSTNITIDGVTARNLLTDGAVGRGPYTISIEAVREYQVSTNDYDVAQGRQGGGSLNAVTKNGTNRFEGLAFAYHRNNRLASPFDIRGVRRNFNLSNFQYGFTLGGPIIKDKLHYFVAFDRQNETTPEYIADIRSADDEQRLGITKENLERVIAIGREKYGLGAEKQYGEFERKSVANTLFTRLDWIISPKHTLTFRNNFSSWNNPFSVNDNSNINLAESWSDFSSVENSALASLRSTLSPNLTNEFKIQYQYAYRAYMPHPDLPKENIPRAIVTVTSVIPTSTNPNATQTRTVQFGGQRFTTETDRAENLQIANTTYWRAGRFNFKFGTDNLVTFLDTKLVNEMNGRFLFANLADFAAQKPNRYAREVPITGDPSVRQVVLDLSAFAQVEFNPHRDLNLLAGLRYDATLFTKRGDFNPVVFRTLGIRTDSRLSDFNNVQPRFQLTWDVAGRQRDVVKIGGGLYSAQPVAYLQVNNIQNSGTLVGAIDVSGTGVPAPDFVSYRRNPSTAPGIPAGAQYVSTINAVSDDFQVPTVLKANASYNRFFGDRLRVGFNALWSRTVNNYVYFDRNLVDEPYFRLSNENGRGVFVPANTIPAANGTTDWTKSRKTDEVGRVLELESTGVLEQMAFVADISYRVGKDGYASVSYTINDAQDNSSFNCCVANTSTFRPVVDDPRQLERSYSDNHYRNKLVVNGATPTVWGFQLGATYTGTGGTRFNFMTGGNRSLNGDFVLTNDLAFVFDPNDERTPATIRKDMQALLDNPNTTEAVRTYLRGNLGRVAERNGGINPFYGVLDLRLTKAVKLYKTHRLELSADCFNFLNLLDRTKGVSNNHGSNVNLVSIQGFNAQTQNYNYRVESGAGTLPLGGTPWRIQAGARYAF
jgi:hypothetical protein